jgi:hypothetical protein
MNKKKIDANTENQFSTGGTLRLEEVAQRRMLRQWRVFWAKWGS